MALLVGIPISALTRLIGCIFSKDIRQRVKRRPIIHILWFIAGFMIVVLMLMPCTPRQRRSLRHDTKRLVTAITYATRDYRNEYGQFPLQSNDTDHIHIDDQARYIAALCGKPFETNDNRRKIAFLEYPQDRLSDEGYALDGWGKPLILIADWNHDDSVLVGTSIINSPLAVWSYGDNGQNDYGNADDVCSWKN